MTNTLKPIPKKVDSEHAHVNRGLLTIPANQVRNLLGLALYCQLLQDDQGQVYLKVGSEGDFPPSERRKLRRKYAKFDTVQVVVGRILPDGKAALEPSGKGIFRITKVA